MSSTTTNILANEFYENDFLWEEIRDLRLPIWESKEIVAEPTTTGLLRCKYSCWDELYCMRGQEMFKPRRYIIKAFPELESLLNTKHERLNIADIGCGAGATLLPILQHIHLMNITEDVRIFASDISKQALVALRERVEPQNVNDDGGEKRRTLITLEWDLTKPIPTEGQGLMDFSADVGMMIFTLSAIHPSEQLTALIHAVQLLRPGGILCFRDYGAYDMIQERCTNRISDWTVLKDDGVLCTFYTIEKIEEMFSLAGLQLVGKPRYCTVKNINRKQNSEMKRVFIRAVGKKKCS
jgi:methyltransferase-like protein 6